MKYIPAFIFFMTITGQQNYGQPLAAADGLGRILPQHEQVGSPRAGRHVAVFYFLWQGEVSSPTSARAWDLTKLWQDNPAVFDDFNHPGWGGGAGVAGKYYFWGEPVYGYYRGDDYWVHLRNIQLLTDAGVDILVIDATNRLTYPQQSDALMRAMEAVRKQGRQPPKIVFYTNTHSGEAMQEIYNNCYKEGAPHRYPACWFYLEGKPLIIGLPDQALGKDYASFFTIRRSQWPNEPQQTDGWPWMEFERPQKVYYNHKGEKEIVNVSAAQHPNLNASMGGSAFYGQPGNWGRSYRKASPGDPGRDLWYGYNVQEQWDFALQQDVPFIFVTGWNEWIVGKWRKPGNDKQSHFVDQASPEYSRDMEPSLTAGLKDHYYMQLVANIRRYKGIDPQLSLGTHKTIRTWADWQNVGPDYRDYVGDIMHRDHPGASSEPDKRYLNRSGRNDFKLMKIARDNKNVYFYVQTANVITGDPSGGDWMTLYIDADRSHSTGWLGYDFRVVTGRMLQRYSGGQWRDVVLVAGKVATHEMMLTIPRKKIGVGILDFEFKWTDNALGEDPLDWYINGDAAPDGRFNYRVREGR